jgi:hypothetical protein
LVAAERAPSSRGGVLFGSTLIWLIVISFYQDRGRLRFPPGWLLVI